MQDRISKYPGRFKLTDPETGESRIVDLEYADEPTVPGTPLNKANLLTDATASLLGLTSSATVNTALEALANGVKKAGEAETANQLKTARYIDGVPFDGTRDIHHVGTCSSSADEQIKVVTCASLPNFEGVRSAEEGTRISVYFRYRNTADSPLLSINNSIPTRILGEYSYGWQSIYRHRNDWIEGSVVEFVRHDYTWYQVSRDGNNATYDVGMYEGNGKYNGNEEVRTIIYSRAGGALFIKDVSLPRVMSFALTIGSILISWVDGELVQKEGYSICNLDRSTGYYKYELNSAVSAAAQMNEEGHDYAWQAIGF